MKKLLKQLRATTTGKIGLAALEIFIILWTLNAAIILGIWLWRGPVAAGWAGLFISTWLSLFAFPALIIAILCLTLAWPFTKIKKR